MTSFLTISAHLRGEQDLRHSLLLRFLDCDVDCRSNDAGVIAALRSYFHRHLEIAEQDQRQRPAITVDLIEGPVLEPPLPLAIWPRGPEKATKEAFSDIDQGRVIHKVRTGLLFLQGLTRGVASGPLSANLNQVINFINNQTMSLWHRNGWTICHASAVQGERGAVAFAGFSGGGKSTLMLHLMRETRCTFISNDRVLVKRDGQSVLARGVAKLPRVNPGTLLNNPKLTHILPEARHSALATLSKNALWQLEEKYDVPVADIFGPDRLVDQGRLIAFVILDWSPDDPRPTTLEPCTLHRGSKALEALMKQPGPFHAISRECFQPADAQLDPTPYVDTLENIAAYKLTGNANFDRAVELLLPLLAQSN